MSKFWGLVLAAYIVLSFVIDWDALGSSAKKKRAKGARARSIQEAERQRRNNDAAADAARDTRHDHRR